MWIPRDLERQWPLQRRLPVRLVRGLRQCGKSSLLERLDPSRRVVSLDDLDARALANRDPSLFLQQFPPPVTIDEAHWAPALFPELKRRIDDARRTRRDDPGSPSIDIAWMTGSNQLELDRAVHESLAGRVSYSSLHTLSVHELVSSGACQPGDVPALLLRSGFPELHADRTLAAGPFLDDFVQTYVERDVVLAAGIEKRGAFMTLLRHLAARSGELLNASELASLSGVQVSTVLGWIDILERMLVVRRLAPWSSNLHKRLTKTPKLYFLDAGLAARLQGWRELQPLLYAPQAGPLFETLVFGELVRTIDHAGLALDVHLFRTKEGTEVDFLVSSPTRVLALDAKLAISGVSPQPVPPELRKAFPQVETLHLVTSGGERRRLSRDCTQVPVAGLFDLLHETFSG